MEEESPENTHMHLPFQSFLLMLAVQAWSCTKQTNGAEMGPRHQRSAMDFPVGLSESENYPQRQLTEPSTFPCRQALSKQEFGEAGGRIPGIDLYKSVTDSMATNIHHIDSNWQVVTALCLGRDNDRQTHQLWRYPHKDLSSSIASRATLS